MDSLIVIFIIAAVINAVLKQSKAKQADAKKQQERQATLQQKYFGQEQRPTDMQPPRRAGTYGVPNDPRFPPVSLPQAPPERHFPQTGTTAQMETSPRRHAPTSPARQGEQTHTSSARATMQSHLQATKGRRHALEQDEHAHVESSMRPIREDCPPPWAAPASPTSTDRQRPTSAAIAFGQLLQDRNALVQGILLGEILGRPKALRR